MIAHRLLLALTALPVAAQAEVKSTTPTGFEVESRATVPAPPAKVYATLLAVGGWWNGAHTYSGDAARLSIDPRAGGCFCETLPDGGSVEHLRIVQARPGVLLRLQGALGPLQAEGLAGSLTWTLKPSGAGAEIVQTYVVGGYLRAGIEKMAPAVDGVLSEQFARLVAKLGDEAGRARD